MTVVSSAFHVIPYVSRDIIQSPDENQCVRVVTRQHLQFFFPSCSFPPPPHSCSSFLSSFCISIIRFMLSIDFFFFGSPQKNTIIVYDDTSSLQCTFITQKFRQLLSSYHVGALSMLANQHDNTFCSAVCTKHKTFFRIRFQLTSSSSLVQRIPKRENCLQDSFQLGRRSDLIFTRLSGAIEVNN